MGNLLNPGAATTSTPNYYSSPFAYELLFILPFANMQLNNQDQQFTRIFSGSTYDPLAITAIWKSGAYSTSCTGGIYPLPSRGGTGLVSSTQSYAGLSSGPFNHVNVTIQATTQTFYQTPFLNINAANSGALFAEFRIYGVCYD